MKETLVNFVANFPNELAVILLSVIPVAELRFAIPFAVLNYGMHPALAFLYACIGNLLPVPFIILFIRKIPIFNTTLRKFIYFPFEFIIFGRNYPYILIYASIIMSFINNRCYNAKLK